MSVLVRCPGCPATVRVGRERLGRRVRCAGCDLAFRLATPVGERVADADPEVTDAPPRGRPQPSDRSRARSGRPARRSNGPLLVGLLAAGVLMLGGCGLGGFLVFRAVRAPDEPVPEVADAREPDPAPAESQPPPPELTAPPTNVPQPYVLTPYEPKRPEPVEPEPVAPAPIRPEPVKPKPGTSGPVELKLDPLLTGPKPVKPKPAEPKPVIPPQPRFEEGEAVALGGPLRTMHTSGGRYLVFLLSDPRRLVVYDVAARKEVSTIDVPDQNVQVAVGREKVFVGRWRDGRITRYDLRTGKLEATGGADPPERLSHLATSAEGDGPLVSGTNRANNQFQARLYDPETLAPLSVPIESAGARKDDHPEFPFSQPLGAAHIAVSADGRGISLSTRYYTRTAAGYKAVPVNPSSGLRPTPDGSALVGNSLWTPTGRLVPFADREPRWMIPAATGPFFLSEEYGAGHESRLMLHTGSDPKPLGVLPTGPGFAAWAQKGVGVGSHLCIAFLPEPGLLVLAPFGSTEARLVAVDLPALLAKAGRDLVFTSVPPAIVPRNRKYTYQATAVIRTGARPTFKLESGPAGMTVSATGALAWNPDANFGHPTADVRLTAQTADGKSVVQEFTLFFDPK